MKSGPLSKRRVLARITIAQVVPWFVVLLSIHAFVPFLVDTALPFWTGLGLIETADGLLLFSIIIVPLVIWLHARLCSRHKLSLVAHISIGSATASLVLLIAYFPVRHIQVVPNRFPVLVVLAPGPFIVIVAGVIGAIASGSVWYFAVRPLLHARDAEIVSRFD